MKFQTAMARPSIICLLLTIAAAVSAETPSKPNVILMMADDLGYGDLSCYGGTRIETPVLDQLAADGVRLTDFYAGAAVCTPSRMALMTGAYPTRVGWQGGVIGYKIDWKHGLTTEARTFAEIFQDAGYATGMCGKWHLGDGEGMQPMSQGFDSAYYIKSSNNQTKKLWRGEELVEDPFDNRLLTEKFVNEAIDFIQANRTKPFFLYLPFTAPHFPAQAHPDWDGKSSNEAYGDVVAELDHRIGEILETLKTEGLEQRTIVVFLSDNGPEKGQRKWATANPYRGLKWTSLEGGTRVPCIIRWPGVVPAGRTCDELVAAIDLLPMLAHACDVKLEPGSPKIDGWNGWERIVSAGHGHTRSELLYWDGWATPQAIRIEEWKLFFDEVAGVEGSDVGPALFNLTDDPTEQRNLSAKHPDKVALMKTRAQQLLGEIAENSMALGGVPDPPEPKRPRWLD